MEYVPINFRIFLQPVNWFTILLMLVIAGFVVETSYNFVVSHFAAQVASSENS